MRTVEAVRPPHAILKPTSLPKSSRLRISLDSDGLQQLLKEELRLSILSKRPVHSRSEAKAGYPEPMIHEMNGVDVERKERRREQNRRAAQRCRRKKRISQLSAMQNYEWVMSRNQQLQQELSHLRQEMTRIASVLKAHRNACTCVHVHKGPLHVQSVNVKLEPGDYCPGPKTGWTTPPQPSPAPAPSRCVAMSSCQYESAVIESSLVVTESSVSVLSQEHEQRSPQMSSQQTPFYASPCQERAPSYCVKQVTSRRVSCVSPPSSQVVSHVSPSAFPVTPSGMGYHPHLQPRAEEHQHMPGLGHHYNVPNMQENPFSGQPQAERGCLQEEFRGSVPMPAYGPAPMHGVPQPLPAPVGPFALLEDLAVMSGGVGSCLFHAEAATPLSADGRRSISSVSSDDVSGGSEPASREGSRTDNHPSGVPLGGFYVTEEVSTNELSQLLSQINQSDLLFNEGGLDDVFSDQGVGVPSLPHFLHSH